MGPWRGVGAPRADLVTVRVSAPEDAWVVRVRTVYDEVSAPHWRAVLAWSSSADVADEAVAEGVAQLLGRGPEVRDPAADRVLVLLMDRADAPAVCELRERHGPSTRGYLPVGDAGETDAGWLGGAVATP